MKGIVFQLLEQTIVEEHGEDTWEEMLEAASLDGAYTSLASYPDEQIGALVSIAAAALHRSPAAVVRWFGLKAFPRLAAKYPDFVVSHSSAIPFLRTLNGIIHPEVRKLYPGAEVPEFEFETAGDNVLIVGYSSRRKLCALAEGLIEGAAAHFHQRVMIDQPICMLQGHSKCELRCSFTHE